MIRLNNDWHFAPAWTDDFPQGGGKVQAVRLPHTVAEIPLHYADSDSYQMVCGYRRTVDIPDAWLGKRLFLQFDGAAHIATVYCNGRELATHRCGYTAFRVEITDAVHAGENTVAVRLDTTENSAVPPFGFVIDYLTYGGLYRDVWLDVRPKVLVTDLFVHTPTLTTASVSWQVDGGEAEAMVELLDHDGAALVSQKVPAGRTGALLDLPGARSWSPEHPVLYRCRVTVGADTQETTFGFRTAEFRADGFYLNGNSVFLRGLNRHQSYPYVGYAVPERLQREDVRILRHELQCSTVRTSHYPQSPYFLDECDREGLLVFTELPGWQHIGDEDWKAQAVENVREMVLQNRNHPSIILWGVRINESLDDDPFYTMTNTVAHDLDPSRATSGVRYLEKSSLLEDVYAYNDFSHTGRNAGCKPKADVTPDMGKALLISECNGHMYPTKSFDTWERRQEQALRHARVQDAARADGEHAGCYGWCMFDYPTHKDFGSGDRVCYHGVLDAFRNPKLAAALYASQGEEQPVLEVGTSMDIGDYPGGVVRDVYVFTNADEVALYKNDQFVTTLRPTGWKGLRHGPMAVEDTIGCLLETQEGYPKQEADALRQCLLAAKQYGMAGMPLKEKLRMGWCMLRYHLTYNDGVALYNKYVGNWGGESTRWRFDAVRDGQVVASVTKTPTTALHLEVRPSHTDLTEGEVYDMAAVRVRVLDQFGSPVPYAQLPVTFTLTGPAQLVGPATVTAEGGMCGTYLRTTGDAGDVMLTISTPQTEPVTVAFRVTVAAVTQ
jgi:beta-galactosidase